MHYLFIFCSFVSKKKNLVKTLLTHENIYQAIRLSGYQAIRLLIMSFSIRHNYFLRVFYFNLFYRRTLFKTWFTIFICGFSKGETINRYFKYDEVIHREVLRTYILRIFYRCRGRQNYKKCPYWWHSKSMAKHFIIQPV